MHTCMYVVVCWEIATEQCSIQKAILHGLFPLPHCLRQNLASFKAIYAHQVSQPLGFQFSCLPSNLSLTYQAVSPVLQCVFLWGLENTVSLHWLQSLLWDSETTFCPEWSRGEDLTSHLGSLSFVLQPYAMQYPLYCPLQAPMQLWLSNHHAVNTREQNWLSSVLPPNSHHWLWLQRSVRLRLKLPWKHLTGREENGKN